MSTRTSWLLLPTVSVAVLMTMTFYDAARADKLTQQRKAELTNLVRHDCGSCHGMTLKGGLGTPLLPQIMAEYEADDLVEIILDGVPGTPMPPWRELLKIEEAQWMVKQLQSGQIKRGNTK
jgi:cytochrome c55X